MGSSPPSRLSALQRDLLAAFFAREQRLFLTGGGALVGFYLGHRDTDDLDLFTRPGLDLAEATRVLEDAASASGAGLTAQQTHPSFRRLLASRGEERCIVDLVIDDAPAVDLEKVSFGAVRVDTQREIAANKICTLLGRSEIKDLVDLQALVHAGIDLERALADALQKDAGADPATLAWILGELSIAPGARLPGGVDASALEAFRQGLVHRLLALAYAGARQT
jgi:predicted nucleotidyltransferase component of viral defense system